MVVFPGIGYHTDKPLLYYAKKLAKEYDYEIIEIAFSNLSKSIFGKDEEMKEAFKIGLKQVEEQLDNVDFKAYKDVIFVSKSIGTVAASLYANKYELKARQVYYTPLEYTFSYVEEGNGIVFMGLNDPWVNTDNVIKYCNDKKLKLTTFLDANHSIETGNVETDLENLNKVVKATKEYIVL